MAVFLMEDFYVGCLMYVPSLSALRKIKNCTCTKVVLSSAFPAPNGFLVLKKYDAYAR